MGFNLAGLSSPFNINRLSLHATNPGEGASPTAGTELTDAPYARQDVAYSAPALVTGGAEAALDADAVFDLSLTVNQNVQFVGVWTGSTYKGFFVPDNANNFTGVATERSFTVGAGSILRVQNQA
jgi:hypothetical protein